MRIQSRPFEWGVYAVAALLVAIPLFESMLPAWPPRFGEATWRVGVAGALSQALLTPLLGVLLCIVGARVYERRVVAYLAAVGAVGLFLLAGSAIATVAWDLPDMRALVNPDAQDAYGVAAVLTVGKTAALGLTALLLTVAAWQVAGGLSAARRSSSKDAAPGKIVSAAR